MYGSITGTKLIDSHQQPKRQVFHGMLIGNNLWIGNNLCIIFAYQFQCASLRSNLERSTPWPFLRCRGFLLYAFPYLASLIMNKSHPLQGGNRRSPGGSIRRYLPIEFCVKVAAISIAAFLRYIHGGFPISTDMQRPRLHQQRGLLFHVPVLSITAR